MDELFEMLSSLLGFAVSIGIVVKMEPTAASMKVMGTPERTPPRAKSAQTPAAQMRMPPEKIEQKQPQGSLHYVSHEGVELHEDGFHGQNRANRTNPADVIFAESGPRVTAEQMRNALIMKEILDAPVSRRGARGRRYGR